MTGKNFRCMLILSLSVAALLIGSATKAGGQEKRIEIEVEDSLPLPIQTGARWLRLALLPLAQEEQQPAAADQPAASPQIREIEAVRNSFGGSIVRGKVFDEIAPVNPAELRRVLTDIERDQAADGCPGMRQVTDCPLLTQASEQYAAPLDPLQAAADQLRVSARNLDLLAADLEDAGKYSDADRLRVSAARLRRDARTLQP